MNSFSGRIPADRGAYAPLHVVAVLSNPMGWESRIRLYRGFAEHMLDSGVRLTTVECAYGNRPFCLAGDKHINHVAVRAKTVLWVKENLINIGIARLPQDWQYVAWIDADIFFRKSSWATATVDALQRYDVVQPWSDCYDLGPNDEHLHAHRSFCRQWAGSQPIGPGPYVFAHPGYAWAATREALEHLGGLIDTAILGAADHHMALGLIGRAEQSVPAGIAPEYARLVHDWQARASCTVAGNIGFVPGTIEHLWHGAKEKRRYIDRWQILLRHEFSPTRDLRRNVWGVWELAGNKPALRRDIDAYMRQRDEDDNSVD